jgi:hypothetical protein
MFWRLHNKPIRLLVVLFTFALSGVAIASDQRHEPNRMLLISREGYLDKAKAIWTAQMIGQLTGLRFEHKPASVLNETPFVHAKGYAEPDDDYYYEIVAVRAFEKYGTHLSVQQLGEQWLENNAGTWGSSEQTLLLLKGGVHPPDTGSPRYNKLWWTIGAQFSSDLYGILAPGMPDLAADMARKYGHINGYAEGTDGAVFIASMVSMGFVESDAKQIVRKAAHMISPQSPYRRCLDEVIAMAEAGKTPDEIADDITARWGIEYPATNNAVVNGALVAISIWFGGGDFTKTENLAFRAADYADADCNAANAASVIAAMHGMAALPADVVASFHDRIYGDHLGGVMLTPPVDESISLLAQRTVHIGEQILLEHGAHLEDGKIAVIIENPRTQAPELFKLSDLTNWWSAGWTLERAGFGGAGGGLRGILGNTYLDSDVLSIFPRDTVRGAMLRKAIRLGDNPIVNCDVGANPDRTWHLQIFVNNDKVLDNLISGRDGSSLDGNIAWRHIRVNLEKYRDQEVTLRLYDLVLVPGSQPGNSYWKNLVVE